MHLQLRCPAFPGPTSGKSMRTILCVLALTLATLSAWAQTRDENVKRCMSDHPDISINGCTALIQSGQESTANMAAAYNKRGEAYHENFEDEHAVADYTKAIEIRSDYAEAYSNRCAAEDNQGLHDQAIADCTKAITLKPDYAEAYNNRGKAYNFKNLHDQTIADCSQAIALKPDYAEAYAWRAHAYQVKGEDAKGLRDAEKAVALAPQEVGTNVRKAAVKSIALGTMAEIYEKLGQRDKAVANYLASCARCPWVLDALKRLGAPIPTEAQLSALEKADARDSWEQKGLAAVKQQDWNVALQNLLVAQEIDPESPTVLFNLGLTSEKIPGHELRAIAWFQAYLLVAPAAPDAAAVRNEVTSLEVSYEAKNRLILAQLDSFVSLAKKNIDELSANGTNREWAKAASTILGYAAEFQAGSHYFVGDEPGALHVLHAADEKIFRDGRLIIPSLDSSNMTLSMVSAGIGVESIIGGDKSGEFRHGEINALEYLLEAGDLLHARTFVKGWKPNDEMWILGMERLLCTAHDRSDAITFGKISAETEKALAGLAGSRGYTDLVRLYLEMGEVTRAEALSKAIPGELGQQAPKPIGFPTATGLIEDFHQGRIRSQGACPEKIWILKDGDSPNSQVLEWNSRVFRVERAVLLWWSTGRVTFLADVGRNGMKESLDEGWDETRLGDYIKKVGDEILADPYSIKNNTMELARVEFLISETYRQVRGPIHTRPDVSH
jgi:tetratricopeptide (TPR) repeat protein